MLRKLGSYRMLRIPGELKDAEDTRGVNRMLRIPGG